MKIDVRVPPCVMLMNTTFQQQASSLSFEDLFSLPPGQHDGSGAVKPAPKPRHLFSFDALGILGVGETRTPGATQEQSPPVPLSPFSAVPTAINATPQVSRAQDAAPLPGYQAVTVGQAVNREPVIKAGAPGPNPTKPAPVTASTAVSHSSLPSLANKVAVAAASSAPSDITALPEGPSAPIVKGPAPLVAASGSYYSEVTAEAPSAPILQLKGIHSGATALHRGATIAPVDTPEAEARTASNASPSKVMNAKKAEPPSAQVSVTVSESDGTIQVVAAVPDLTEKSRLKIRGIAEDIANEAGVTLGDFFLNGTTMPQFHKLIDRSL